jgi:hypothetical protein
MTEETVRTRTLHYTRNHWKGVLHFASWALAGLVTYEFSQGKSLAQKEMTASEFTALQTEVHGMHEEVRQMKESQARTEGTLSAISVWAQGMAKFQAGVQQGAVEALATPVPKLTGHRAKH